MSLARVGPSAASRLLQLQNQPFKSSFGLIKRFDCSTRSTANMSMNSNRPAIVNDNSMMFQQPFVRSFATSPASNTSSPHHKVDSLLSRLKDKSLFNQHCFVNGQWIDSQSSTESSIKVTNPSTGALVGTTPHLSPNDIKTAIKASHEAHQSYSRTTSAERAKLLYKWHELIIASQVDLATILTSEQGKPHAEAVGEIAYSASFIKVFADECAAGAPQSYDEHDIKTSSPSTRVDVIHQPVGPCFAITPWNFPSAMFARKLAAAFAAGNSITLKPSELTPFTAFAFAELAKRARFPRGVVQMVTGDSALIAKAFLESPLIRKVTFTGSTRVGKLLIKQSTANLTRLSLELGGSAPFIVFDDIASLDVAVAGLIACKFRNAGQTCVSANRIFVQRGVYDAFVKALHAQMQAKLVVGDGFAGKQVLIGPLINAGAVEKTHAHVTDAVSKGGQLLLGGYSLKSESDISKAQSQGIDASRVPLPNAGNYYAPTLVVGCDESMAVWTEETFGPAALIFPFDSEEQVIKRANDTIYGLASYVYTGDEARGQRVAEALQFGMCAINSPSVSLASAPFGGMKQSGVGREGGGRIGMKDYIEIKTIHKANKTK